MKQNPTNAKAPSGGKNRGAVKRIGSELIGARFPDALVALIDRAVQQQDTDRSKFFRAAVREKLRQQGMPA